MRPPGDGFPGAHPVGEAQFHGFRLPHGHRQVSGGKYPPPVLFYQTAGTVLYPDVARRTGPEKGRDGRAGGFERRIYRLRQAGFCLHRPVPFLLPLVLRPVPPGVLVQRPHSGAGHSQERPVFHRSRGSPPEDRGILSHSRREKNRALRPHLPGQPGHRHVQSGL